MTEIRTFKGAASGRPIAFNASLELPVLLGEVSFLDIQSVIAEFERRRIREYWDKKLLCPSKQGPWLDAFSHDYDAAGTTTYRNISKYHHCNACWA